MSCQQFVTEEEDTSIESSQTPLQYLLGHYRGVFLDTLEVSFHLPRHSRGVFHTSIVTRKILLDTFIISSQTPLLSSFSVTTGVFKRHLYTRATHLYAVATVSRIDQTTGLLCRISSVLQGSFAKETYHFIDPTNRSHPIQPSQTPLLSSHTPLLSSFSVTTGVFKRHLYSRATHLFCLPRHLFCLPRHLFCLPRHLFCLPRHLFCLLLQWQEVSVMSQVRYCLPRHLFCLPLQ